MNSATKTLTVAACGTQSVIVPAAFTSDACRAVARAVVGAIGAALRTGTPIARPWQFAQSVANVRVKAWVAGNDAWFEQIARDKAQAASVEAQRLVHSPRPDEPTILAALVVMFEHPWDLDKPVWQAVKNTFGHAFWRDISGRHHSESCDTCTTSACLALPFDTLAEQEATADAFLRSLNTTGAQVLDIYTSLRAGTPPALPEAVMPTPAISTATWTPGELVL